MKPAKIGISSTSKKAWQYRPINRLYYRQILDANPSLRLLKPSDVWPAYVQLPAVTTTQVESQTPEISLLIQNFQSRFANVS
jgi:hypothetical protein